MKFLVAIALLFAPASLLADTLNYEWQAEVSSGGTCQPYCGPYGFDVHNGDWITGTLSMAATGAQSAMGTISAVIGSTAINGPASFGVRSLSGTPMILMWGPDSSYAWLHPMLGSGCGIYGCPEFPTRFDEIVFEVRTNHGPDLDPLDWGPPQARYLNAWCSNSSRCIESVASVPEPSTLGLLATGIIALGLREWLKNG